MTTAQAIAAQKRGVVLGAPRKFTPVQVAEIAQDLSEYIETTDDCTIVGFISKYKQYSLDKTWLTVNLKELVNRAILKQEAFLIRQFDKPTMAIFRLKQPQHGYTDRQDINSTNVNINVDIKADKTLAADFTEYLKGRKA